MNSDFELVLEDCLVRLRSGISIESCLSSYPEQAEDLRPLLTAAVHVHAISVPQARPQAVEAGRKRMFAALERQTWAGNTSQTPVSNRSLSRYTERISNFLRIVLIGKEHTGMKYALRLAVDFVIFLVVAGVFTLNASASTLPGDPLYGVKRTWEEVRLSLSSGDLARQKLQSQLEAERRAEIEKLIQLRRPVVVEFEGVLEQIGADTWVVSGLQFKMLPETIVQGTPAAGQRVWLRASLQADGQLIALEVHIENVTNPMFGPNGTYVTPGQSTSTPWNMYNGTSIPSQMQWGTPWGNQSPYQTPMPSQWSTPMPGYHYDNHNTWESPTNPPANSTSQPPAPTSQHHNNQPASTQRPWRNHNPGSTQCRDCSHDNWGGHDGYHH